WQRFTQAVGEARRTLPIRSERVRARLRGYESAYAYIVGQIGEALNRWEHTSATGRSNGKLAQNGGRR
ncbi:MAG TPA: hypothetical protein VJQ46_16345, partial [Gemmatimonadales bacterium]|nr:hypothetical protein [Gemmatimonadales bacterium]